MQITNRLLLVVFLGVLLSVQSVLACSTLPNKILQVRNNLDLCAETYQINNNHILNVSGKDITISCNGATLHAKNSSIAIYVIGNGSSVTLRDCVIKDFDKPLWMGKGVQLSVDDTTTIVNAVDGITYFDKTPQLQGKPLFKSVANEIVPFSLIIDIPLHPSFLFDESNDTVQNSPSIVQTLEEPAIKAPSEDAEQQRNVVPHVNKQSDERYGSVLLLGLVLICGIGGLLLYKHRFDAKRKKNQKR